MSNDRDYDVIAVGGGIGGLSAAIAARNGGAKVLVLEKAHRTSRGGNTAFSGGGFRFWRTGMTDIEELVPDLSEEERRTLLMQAYSADNYYDDVMRVTKGLADPELAGILVRESNPTVKWLKDQGVGWEIHRIKGIEYQGRLRYPPQTRIIRAKGGGKGLSDFLFDSAERKAIDVLYETTAVKLLVDFKGKVCGVRVQGKEGFKDIKSNAVILATGGFESNREWRARYLGPGWDFVRPRGTRFNHGDGLRMALEIGAKPAGHWSGCHATAFDYNHARIPEEQDLDGLEWSRNDYRACIEVNANGVRFLDEGEDWRDMVYVKHGQSIVQQPQQMAWQIYDAKVIPLLFEGYPTAPRVTADSVGELADKLGMPALTKTVEEFNAAVQEEVPLNFSILDGKGTRGITPAKSNWAQKIDTPPFVAYHVACAITFTFGGIKINSRGQVLDTVGEITPGLYATGTMIGGVWHYNYTGGGGNMLAAVFGRIAGANAAGE